MTNAEEQPYEDEYQYQGSLTEDQLSQMTPAQQYLAELVETVNNQSETLIKISNVLEQIDNAIQTLDQRTRENHRRINEIQEQL